MRNSGSLIIIAVAIALCFVFDHRSGLLGFSPISLLDGRFCCCLASLVLLCSFCAVNSSILYSCHHCLCLPQFAWSSSFWLVFLLGLAALCSGSHHHHHHQHAQPPSAQIWSNNSSSASPSPASSPSPSTNSPSTAHMSVSTIANLASLIQFQPNSILHDDETIDAISRGKHCATFPFKPVSSTVVSPLAPGQPASNRPLKVNNLRTVMSRFHHQQINIPMSHKKRNFFRKSFADNERCRRTQKCIDLLANVLATYDPTKDDFRLLVDAVHRTPSVEANVYRLSIAWTTNDVLEELSMNNSVKLRFFLCDRNKLAKPILQFSSPMCQLSMIEEKIQTTSSWLSERLIKILLTKRHYIGQDKADDTTEWSNVFYDCKDRRWFITYHSLILEPIEEDAFQVISNLNKTTESNKSDQTKEDNSEMDDEEEDKVWYRVKGFISADVDVSHTDINQCENPLNFDEYLDQNFVESKKRLRRFDGENQKENSTEEENEITYSYTDETIVLNLYGTHKCHLENSKCEFQSGHGMFRGGYQCKCKDGFHSAVTNLGPTFNGSLMEQSYQDKHDGKNPSYDYMFYCKRCAPGCDVCKDESPCLSTYNWAFRISLLTITILCIIFVFVLAFNIYRYRKLKVIKVASPIFLCITLLGCAIMYCEAVVIFPVLDVWTCVLTKWARNFGFCITYSALLLKTWRVSLTYRVKSAHKIKLTDKQLLQWLFPILLVMAIYLAAWTISDTPQTVYIVDWNNLKFKQCDYNWWDHSLIIGEFFFLIWGTKVCYNVRNAESLFNEAKYITWAIYNITVVNIIMILIHVFILPNSGPDIKYFFGFVRTQLSTTTTVILIFGPKFYRVVKGEGDLWDKQLRARGIAAASFSFNGVGLAHEETTDLYQENEELKEEIQKLAAQLEIMKLCQMEFKNRHLSSGKFSKMQQQTQQE